MEFEIDDDPQDADCDRYEADRQGGLREDHLLRTRCERTSDNDTTDRATRRVPSSYLRRRLSKRMADRVGFEPTVGVNPRRFSRPLP